MDHGRRRLMVGAIGLGVALIALVIVLVLRREGPAGPAPGRDLAAAPPLFGGGVVDPAPYTPEELTGPLGATWKIFELSDSTRSAIAAGRAFAASLVIEGSPVTWTFDEPTARADGFDWEGRASGSIDGDVSLASIPAQ